MDIINKLIPVDELRPKTFIRQKVREITQAVGNGTAIVALSGGVDSSVTTVLGHRALGKRLKVFFIDNGLMRQDESDWVRQTFGHLDIEVIVTPAQDKFFKALKGLRDPEEVRKAITETFYGNVFAGLVKKSGAKCLLQGTIYTDIEETVAGIKRQHNVLEQLGIDTKRQYGYKVIEPLIELRKDGVRKLAQALALPPVIYNRMPFPGPALAVRVIGEVSREKVETVRQATTIVEDMLAHTGAFQFMAILHEDLVTGVRDGKRAFGYQIEVRCWNTTDATTAMPTELPYQTLGALAQAITTEIPEVVSVTYNITSKPPSTMEAV